MVRKLIREHPLALLVAGYLLLTAAVSAVLFWRFPNNVLHANFYAEDGSVFLQNVQDKGWLGAAFTPFNGYFVFGMYGLEAVGWICNVLFGDGLLTLPMWFALISIVWMGAIIALPYLLFSKTFGRLKMLAVVAFGVLLPLPLSPHVVIGTVGNQKWIFFYLAVLLVLYRLINHDKLRLRQLIAIDATLLFCAYTNTTTYALIPILFIPHLRFIWTKRKKWLKTITAQLKLREVQSLLLLSLLLLPQIIYIGLHGIPEQAGYLDTPYQAMRSIELFVNRTYLFGVTHIINSRLSDGLAVVLLAIMIGLAVAVLKGRERLVFWISLYAAFMASALFVTNRPGVTDFFAGYAPSGSGPDQFFYAQTLIMYLPIGLLIFGVGRWIAGQFGRRWMGIIATGLLTACVVISGLASNIFYGERWRNASVYENDAGTFIDQSLQTCQHQHGQTVRVVAYPYANGRFSLEMPRSQVCNPELSHYQHSVQDFGLTPDNNNFRTITKGSRLQQTFTANENGLDGVRLFISTFGNPSRAGGYSLALYDQSCRHQLREAAVSTRLIDNSQHNIRFKPVNDSEHVTYCIQIKPPATSNYDQIAIQLSRPDTYRQGVLRDKGHDLPQDMVFAPLYTQTKP